MTEGPTPASPDPDKKPKQATDPEELYVQGTENLRTTAKWLVATFGAVGGALIAGISLSDLGKLEGTDKVLAAVGAGLGIGGVIAVIAVAAWILTTELVVLSDFLRDEKRFQRLREELDRNPSVHPGFKNVRTLAQRMLSLSGDQVGARREFEEAKRRDDETAKAEAQRKFESAKKELRAFNAILFRLRNLAQYEYLRQRYVRGQWLMATAAVVAAAGVGLFAFSNTAPEPEPEPAVSATPVYAIADLDPEGTERVQSAIGAQCDPDRLAVVVTGISDDGTASLIATGAGQKCLTTELTLDANEFVLRPKNDVLDEEIIIPPS